MQFKFDQSLHVVVIRKKLYFFGYKYFFFNFSVQSIWKCFECFNNNNNNSLVIQRNRENGRNHKSKKLKCPICFKNYIEIKENRSISKFSSCKAYDVDLLKTNGYYSTASTLELRLYGK